MLLKTLVAAPSLVSPPLAIKTLRGPKRNRRFRFHFVSFCFRFASLRFLSPGRAAAARARPAAASRVRFILLQPSALAAP